MFDKFGEFGSVNEINELAQNLFNEGDMDSILALAKENGIDQEVAKMYIKGDLPELADAEDAAPLCRGDRHVYKEHGQERVVYPVPAP